MHRKWKLERRSVHQSAQRLQDHQSIKTIHGPEFKHSTRRRWTSKQLQLIDWSLTFK
jgi:hypothetical protein